MFKVRCKLISFEGDEASFPCHFNYKVGEEFYYDGVHFSGRVCPGILASMMPVIHGVYLLGDKYSENVMFRYRGLDIRDPDMVKYDGAGFRPVKTLPKNAPEKMAKTLSSLPRTEKAKGGHFLCADHRILAHFWCEPVDLSTSDYAMPFYRRAIAVLEKIEVEPGINIDELLSKFTEFEREHISPPLTPAFLAVLLDALSDMKYVDIREKRAYATGKEPPVRPHSG